MKLNITNLDYFNPKIPNAFCGYKILHISDLHNASFGNHQEKIIEYVRFIHPDTIFLTGDLIDRNNTNVLIALDLIKGILNMAEIYFVSGNHEWESGKDGFVLMEKMKNMGIRILHDEVQFLEKEGDYIQIMGIDDPFMLQGKKTVSFNRTSSEDFLKRFIKLSKKKQDGFCILLSHRPEFLYFYSKGHIDLVFSGHAHGGQIRLPGIGGLLAPHQGFFPKYTEGINSIDKTSMVVSRGLGNSCFPLRINNTPELVVVNLYSE